MPQPVSSRPGSHPQPAENQAEKPHNYSMQLVSNQWNRFKTGCQNASNGLQASPTTSFVTILGGAALIGALAYFAPDLVNLVDFNGDGAIDLAEAAIGIGAAAMAGMGGHAAYNHVVNRRAPPLLLTDTPYTPRTEAEKKLVGIPRSASEEKELYSRNGISLAIEPLYLFKKFKEGMIETFSSFSGVTKYMNTEVGQTSAPLSI